MTIDEVLSRIKDKFACDYNINGCDTCDISSCDDRDIIIQLAEWLEELKAKRNIGECAYKKGYNRGIDDLIFKINKHKTNGYVTGITHNPFEFGACQMADDIVKIAEKLKGGARDEK